MRRLKILLVVSLLFNGVLLVLGSYVIYKKGGISTFLKSQVTAISNKPTSYYVGKTSIFESVPHTKDEIVFLGDSITDHAEWNELFQNTQIVNRGVSGDSVVGVIPRLSEIVDAKPKMIFIMIGINDFLGRAKTSDVIKNYETILQTIKTKSPTTKVIVQSVLPLNNKIYGNTIVNSVVKEFNGELRKMADTNDFEYVDLYSALSEGDQLKEQYTTDGLHLNGDAYKVWKDAISKYFN